MESFIPGKVPSQKVLFITKSVLGNLKGTLNFLFFMYGCFVMLPANKSLVSIFDLVRNAKRSFLVKCLFFL